MISPLKIILFSWIQITHTTATQMMNLNFMFLFTTPGPGMLCDIKWFHTLSNCLALTPDQSSISFHSEFEMQQLKNILAMPKTQHTGWARIECDYITLLQIHPCWKFIHQHSPRVNDEHGRS